MWEVWQKFEGVLGDGASQIEGGMNNWRFSTNISIQDTVIITTEDV